ncbi:MAG: hypothetical protein ACYC6N_16820 [Pirellulaceae bacterium]
MRYDETEPSGVFEIICRMPAGSAIPRATRLVASIERLWFNHEGTIWR